MSFQNEICSSLRAVRVRAQMACDVFGPEVAMLNGSGSIGCVGQENSFAVARAQLDRVADRVCLDGA